MHERVRLVEFTVDCTDPVVACGLKRCRPRGPDIAEHGLSGPVAAGTVDTVGPAGSR
jgi:hypothetical protein